MKSPFILSIASLVLVALIFSPVLAPADAIVGKPAPDFTLQDSHGQKRALKDFPGKFVVLEWTNYECPFVQKHYGSGNMQKLQKEYTDKGVVWLSICSSGPGKQGNFTPDVVNQRIADLKAAPTAYLIDADGTVGKTYGAKSTPTIFVIDPKGTLVYSGAADSIASTDQADIPKATNYIQQTLDAAMAGKPILVSSTKSYGCAVHYE